MDQSLACAIATSIGFFFNFVAYTSAVNFLIQTNYDESVQSISMIILHLTFTFSSISLTPFLLHNIHPKWVMILGSFGFLWSISCSIIHANASLYFASFMTGIGSSLFWVSSQQIMVRCANVHEITHAMPYNSTIGYFEGIILCAYQLAYCVGNILPNLLYISMNKRYIHVVLCIVFLLCPIMLGHINPKLISGISLICTTSMATQKRFHHTKSPQAIPIYDPIHDDSSFATPRMPTLTAKRRKKRKLCNQNISNIWTRYAYGQTLDCKV
eukprot:574822_1